MPDLLYEKHDTHAVFTLNRPERKNALSGQMFKDLHLALEDFAADPAMRAGIVTGAAGAFCTGMDLKNAAEKARDGRRSYNEERRESRGPFSKCPKPFIAAINGAAIAGGLELALDCDIRICSTDAFFGLWEARRGRVPGYGVNHQAHLVPFQDARYIMLTADRLEAAEGLRIGLVREVLEPDALLPRAVAIANLMASNAPMSLAGIKRIGQVWRQHGIAASHEVATEVAAQIRGSEDAREGAQAFVEKRAPRWQGR